MEVRKGSVEKMVIKNIVQKIVLQYKKYGIYSAAKNAIYHVITRERAVSYGDLHEDKVFYVIRSIDCNSPFYIGPINNLLANYFYVISHIMYAERKNWIPVVDQLNYPVYNSVSFSVNGTFNAWEYYWKQPSGYLLEDVYKSKNVVLSKQNWFSEYDLGYDIKLYKKREIVSRYSSVMSKIHYNKVVKNSINDILRKKRIKNKRILGVNYRFAGHSLKHFDKAKGHPVQPDIDVLINIVSDRIRRWNLEYIFIASDTEEAINAFEKCFPERVMYLARNRYSESLQRGEHSEIYDSEAIYNTSLSYLAEMELLAQCSCLIGSVNSGFRYALLKNNNQYEHIEILDYGLI